MRARTIESDEAPPALGGYAQAMEVAAATRLLFVSGQIPEGRDGRLPDDFRGQCRLAWANVEAQLRAAGMTLDNLVKATTFLADREHGAVNREVRDEVLAGRQVALTVIVAGIFDARWLVEIEAVAAA